METGTLSLDSLPCPTIVLLDLDGTTVCHLSPRVVQALETLDDLANAANRVLARLTLRKAEKPRRKPPRLLVHRAIHSVRRRHVDEIVEPNCGVYPLFETLSQNGIKTGLVSNGLGRGYGRDVVKAFAFEPHFDTMVFREDVRRGKPWPDSILAACNSIGRKLRASDVIWYVGDQRKDVFASLAAAPRLPCPIHPVAFSLRAAAAIIETGLNPDHIILSMTDLDARIRHLLAERDRLAEMDMPYGPSRLA